VRNDNTWAATGSHGDLELFARDLDNYRAALAWAIDTGKDLSAASSMIAALRRAFASRALNAETVRWCDRALTAFGPKPKRALEATLQLALAASMGTMPFFPRFHFYRAADGERFASAAERAFELLPAIDRDAPRRALALSLAAMHVQLTNGPRAEPFAASALSIARESGDPLGIAMALYARSFSIDRSDSATRIALLTEALNLARPVSNFYHSAVILHALGEVAFATGDAAKALSYSQQSVAEQSGHAPINQAQSHISNAAYCLRLGRIDEARLSAQYALTVARRIGEPMIAASALQHVAGIAAACDDPGRAAQLLGASDARRTGAPPRLFTDQTGYDRTLSRVRERISDDRAGRLRDDGFAWSSDEAIEQAMTV
jgi:tetratricopeptide (TPR) repeat protein